MSTHSGVLFVNHSHDLAHLLTHHTTEHPPPQFEDNKVWRLYAMYDRRACSRLADVIINPSEARYDTSCVLNHS